MTIAVFRNIETPKESLKESLADAQYGGTPPLPLVAGNKR